MDVYSNKLTEIEKEIRRAAQKEGGTGAERIFTGEFYQDSSRFFMRGLRWEIKACMGTPESYHKAQEKAIEIERELA